VFPGKRLVISQGVHDILDNLLGSDHADFDLLGAYERWDGELVKTGEGFDALEWTKARLKTEIRAPRGQARPRAAAAGNNGSGADAEEARRAKVERDEATRAEREELASRVLDLLTDDERAAVDAEAAEALETWRGRMTTTAYEDARARARRTAVLARFGVDELKARVRAHLAETKPLEVRA